VAQLPTGHQNRGASQGKIRPEALVFPVSPILKWNALENTEVGGNGIAPALGFRAHKPVRLRVTAESTRRRKLVQ
jgi:hypothetical protein